MKLIESTEDIADLPELIGDTRHLWTHTDEGHKSDSEDRDSSRWKAPQICWDESNNKKDEYFQFFGHIRLIILIFFHQEGNDNFSDLQGHGM